MFLLAPHTPVLYIINAHSVAKPNALDHLQAEMIGKHLDVAIVTETHLKKHHPESTTQVLGYRLIRRDRLGRQGGGVAVMVSDSLRAEEYIR